MHIHGNQLVSAKRARVILLLKNTYSNMTDWNPAEIIGAHPKPLSSNIYEQLITNSVWSQQRYEFGFDDLRGKKLLTFLSARPATKVILKFSDPSVDLILFGVTKVEHVCYFKLRSFYIVAMCPQCDNLLATDHLDLTCVGVSQ